MRITVRCVERLHTTARGKTPLVVRQVAEGAPPAGHAGGT
jgi:hypothetical protein